MALDPVEIERERRRWRALPRERPARIQRPGPGQESVWDYPRPPRVELIVPRLRVEFGGLVLAETVRAWRVIETSSPPVYYFPPADVRTEFLEPSPRSSLCEWKGLARYWSVRIGDRLAADAVWGYPEPDPRYDAIQDHLAFFPGKMDFCSVDGEPVVAQPGEYYGGWISAELVGPFKGEPGSETW